MKSRRGTFWKAKLNKDPTDPAIKIDTIPAGQIQYKNQSQQMSKDNTVVLIVSDDDANSHLPGATVIVRSTRGNPLGYIPSPRWDGGCNKPAFLDVTQPYTITQKNFVQRQHESQLLDPILSEEIAKTLSDRDLITLKMMDVESGLLQYLGDSQKGPLINLYRNKRPIAAKPCNLTLGQVVNAAWNGRAVQECIVISNSVINLNRPLNLVTVAPTAPLADVKPIPENLMSARTILYPEADHVSQICVVMVEQLYTISTEWHIYNPDPVRRVSPEKVASIISNIQGYLELEDV